MTSGRFADIELTACSSCARLWVSYQVEYEAFPESGRWARGMIDAATAADIRPEEVVSFLESLSGYFYGGSFFRGDPGIRSGPMPWG